MTLPNAKRMTPELRKQFIIEQGLKLAEETHYLLFTRGELASACQISPGLVNVYFDGGVLELRKAVLRLAVEREVIKVIAQALVQQDPMIENINSELKNKAIAYIKG